MKKTGPGPVARKKAASNDTIVKASDKSGKMYDISVKKGSGYYNMAKKMGAVPAALRSIDVNKDTDPWVAGVSAAEKKRRLDALSASSKKTKNK